MLLKVTDTEERDGARHREFSYEKPNVSAQLCCDSERANYILKNVSIEVPLREDVQYLCAKLVICGLIWSTGDVWNRLV